MFSCLKLLRNEWQRVVCKVHRQSRKPTVFLVSELDMSHPVSETHHTHPHTYTQCLLGNQRITAGKQCCKHEKHAHQSSQRAGCMYALGGLSEYCEPSLCSFWMFYPNYSHIICTSHYCSLLKCIMLHKLQLTGNNLACRDSLDFLELKYWKGAGTRALSLRLEIALVNVCMCMLGVE